MAPQVGLAGGRGGVHVHFAMKIAEEDYDAAVAGLRGRGQEVRGDRFSEATAAPPTWTIRTATWSSSGPGTSRSTSAAAEAGPWLAPGVETLAALAPVARL